MIARDGGIAIIDLPSGEKNRASVSLPHAVHVSFSPDGNYLLTGCKDGFVRVWEADSLKLLLTCNPPQRTVSSYLGDDLKLGVIGAVFSPDGKQILYGIDNTARLIDIESRKAVQVFSNHKALVSRVCFNSDGRRILSGDIRGHVKLWDTSSGKELSRIDAGWDEPCWALAFKSGGRFAVAVTAYAIDLWRLDPLKHLLIGRGLKNGGWIALTPDGYYDASSEAAEKFLVSPNDLKRYGIEMYREYYHRPDLIRNILKEIE